MTIVHDIVIVGSGPSGVSAAYPLVHSGVSVVMVDGGKQPDILPPNEPYLYVRNNDYNQWKWMLGNNFHALKMIDEVSPKLRIPIHAYVFEDFKNGNNIKTDEFIAIGSLATGGLSNAWGCGIARLSDSEIATIPCAPADLIASYRNVANRIGISGRNDDDMAAYFGVDEWAQKPIEMDCLNKSLFKKYTLHKQSVRKLGFRLGRPRIAVLSENHLKRKACDLSGNCLYGCHRQSLYSTMYDLPDLKSHPNFQHVGGFIAKYILKNGDKWKIIGYNERKCREEVYCGRKILLAAGTLATTRLVLQLLKLNSSVPLLYNPMGAFMLWLPKFIGTNRTSAFGFGQLSFAIDKNVNTPSAFGSLFGTGGIPVTEFIRYLPLLRRNSIKLMHSLLSSCLVGNVFLPGDFSTAHAKLMQDGSLLISNQNDEILTQIMRVTYKTLRKSFLKLGAIILPGSFTIGRAGGSIHYAGTLPMRKNPNRGETDSSGEVKGLDGIHIVDGSCLPILSEKSHTLTIMANADRIGRIISAALRD